MSEKLLEHQRHLSKPDEVDEDPPRILHPLVRIVAVELREEAAELVLRDHRIGPLVLRDRDDCSILGLQNDLPKQ